VCDLFLAECSTAELRAVSGRLWAASGRLQAVPSGGFRTAFSRTGPSTGQWRFELLQSSCLYGCVHLHISKTIFQTSQNFLYMLPVAATRTSFDITAIHYAFPVLWMTSCLPITGQAKATPTWCILVTHQGAASGAMKSNISLVHLLYHRMVHTATRLNRRMVQENHTSCYITSNYSFTL